MRGGERSEAGGFAPKISILRMRNAKKKNENDSHFNCCFFSGTGEICKHVLPVRQLVRLGMSN